MKSKHLLLMLLLALVVPWAANAQTRVTQTFDFEDGAIPSTWTNDATYPWVATTDATNTGTYSIKSGNAGVNSSTSSITATFTFADDGTISFAARCSCEQTNPTYDWDYGTFYIDDVQQGARIINSTTFTTYEYEVDAGQHTFMWKYKKDSSVGSNDDCLYVDDIVVDLGEVQAFPKPTNLAVSNILHNSATLSWAENGTATAWQIGYTANGGTEQYVSVTENPYTLTGLTPLTTYVVRVQSDYQDNTYSLFSNPISFSTTAVAEAVGDSWSDDFEGASCGWELINGTCEDAWVWGTAINNGGTHALYISDDDGTSCNYSHNSVKVFAAKLLNFTDGKFTFSYDWKCYGESNYDFLRVALVPASQTLTAGSDYNTISTTSLPTGWIALDGGGKLNQVQEWQNKEVAVNVTAGNYYLVLAWRSDTSTQNQPPAAVDNVSVTRVACGYDVEGLAVSNITTTTAAIAWTAGEPGQWQVAIKEGADEWDIFPTIANTNTYTITGLNPSTNYQVKVRAYCGGSDYGSWCNPVSFATACDVIDAVGYSENFDSYTAGNNVLPICWSYINTTTYSNYQGYPRIYNYSSNSNPNCLYLNSYAWYSGGTTTYDPQPQYAILPEMTGLADKQVTLMARGSSNTSTFKIGTMSDPTDASTFVAITEQALTTSYQEFEYVIPASASGNYLAIMIDAANESRTSNGAYIDDISINTPPTCIKPTDLEVTANGLSATCTWVSEVGAYEIAHALEATANPDENIVGTATDITFTMNELVLGDHYFWVRANCGGSNGNSQWVGPVSVHIGYCVPNPSSRDGKGITKVNFGTGDYIVNNVDETNGLPATSPYYGDYSSMVGAMQAGVESTISITYATGSSTVFSYGTIIWVDWDNSLSFEDSEIVYTGTSVQGSNGVPQVLDATFTIPADQATGEYRMRIAGADSYFDSYIGGTATGNHSACFSSSYAVCHDYTLRVLEAPSCFTPTGLAVSNVTNHTADLTWTAGADETQWQICINDDETNLINVSTTPYPLTNLAAETEYSVKVRANCGAEDGVSEWSAAVTFTTDVACPAPTNVAISNVEPFSATVSWNGIAENYNLRYRTARGFHYNFESAEPWAVDDFAPCTTYDGDESSTYAISDYDMPNANYVGSVIAFSDNSQWAAHSGNTMGAFMDATIPTNDDYFITPELTIASGDHFIFWARSVTSSYGLERIKVGVYGGNGTITSYLAGSADEYVEVPVAWTEFDYDLTAYAGQTIQLAINCVSDDAFALLIDDLFVGDPTDDTWDQTLTNVTSPYTLTGLTDETMYEVQVQAACGGEDGVSVWVDGGTFTTPSNCAAPTNLAANDVTISSATLSWEGFHNSYNLQYRTAATRETYYFNDFNTDQTGWTYPEVLYGFADPIYNVAGSENFFLAMGYSSTTEDTIVSCELPAYESGAYVEFYYFGYQTANTFQVGYSTTTNDAEAFTWGEPIDAPLTTYTRYQETLAAGVKYVAFKATASDYSACVFIDDFGIFGADTPEGTWQTRNAVTSPYSLTGLANDTKYEWQVQGINTACAGGVTEWSNMANFTTLNACMVPVIDSVNNIEATTATVYWTGAQESYNVRYGSFETATSINFDDGVIPASMTNDETYPWTIDDGHIQSGNAGESSSTSSISITLTLASKGVISFDAMFRGEGTSYDKCIFSIDDTQMFAYGEVDAEWHNIAYTVAAGTHTFTWTYSKDSSVNPDGDFFAIDNIKIQLHNTTWTTVENVAGNSYDMTGLAPESVIAVQVQGNNTVCDGGVTDWSSEYLFITPEQTTFTQTIEMVEGKNWVSFSVEVTLDELKAALVAALPGTQITIQGKANSTTYNGTRWRGQLSTLDLSQMYKVTMTAACQVTLEGMPIDPAEHPVTINGKTGDKPTATWIAFPFGQDMTVADAFAGFAASGDQVKAKDAQTTYNGTRWRGSLTTLESGKGYVYLSNSTENRVFTFPSTSKAAPAKAQVPTGKAVTRPMRASKLAIPTKK